MPTLTQAHRPLAVTTPLGPDVLLLTGFRGSEGLSQLFSFQLDLIAEAGKDIAFDQLLGQPVSLRVDLDSEKKRFFSGICIRFSQGETDTSFTDYRMEVVPAFWLWTKRVQSRIFQHVSVPDILKEVLKGLDVAFEVQGTFQPRDYCVQYRESDFDFASRLMEEEGIYYYFKHSEKSQQLVVANTPQSHADLPLLSTLLYKSLDQDDLANEAFVYEWAKTQELTSGKVTLWDHSFELPHKHLEADKTIQETVDVGKASHKLKVGVNGALEIYDYPGAYAQRFDGVDRGGGAQPADVQKIFDDNKRTVGIRMQEEAATGVRLTGASGYRQLTSGYKFTLALAPGEVQGKALKAEGAYVLTTVTHTAKMESDYRSGDWDGFRYENEFECLPAALPYRPKRVTPRPIVPGSQTAVVVGPAGEEIFTDPYSRVKVQFHWDRAGKNDLDSSCWVRVATHWAGKQWGIIHIPRIGQEVVVDFLEGDPDRPIIVGSVYNAEMMPPYKLPDHKTQSGIKSRSSLKGTPENFNEIRFEDKKGSELLTIHAEKNQSISVEANEMHSVGHDRSKTIGHDETTQVNHNRTETVKGDESITINGNRTETVDKDETITIHGNRTETVDKDEKITITGNRTESVAKDEKITITGGRTEQVGKDESVTITGQQTVSVGKNQSITVGADCNINVTGSMSIIVGEQILLKTGDASILMQKDGSIVIQGKDILIKGSGKISAKADGDMVLKASKIGQN